MKDLQFVILSDLIDILSVSELAGQATRTLKIEGNGDFTYTKKVSINDFSLSEFTVVSKTVLHVPLPDQFSSLSVGEMYVAVFSSQLSSAGKARLEFDLTTRFTSVSGPQKLAQQVLKTLISTAKTNRFNEEEGGSLTKVLGGTMDPAKSAQVASAVARAVADTKTFYTRVQAASGLPANERLLDLSLSSVEFDSTTLEVRATLRLLTFSGESELLPLTL